MKDLLGEVIHKMTQISDMEPPTLIVPLATSTRWASVDLNTENLWTLSGRSSAALLSTGDLQMPDRGKIAQEMAERVALAQRAEREGSEKAGTSGPCRPHRAARRTADSSAQPCKYG